MTSLRHSTGNIIQRHRRRHIFYVFRKPARFRIAPVFLAFAAVDYLYIPDYWQEGLALRIFWTALTFASFQALKNRRFREKYVEIVPIIILVLACWVINWMIFRSGGYTSVYITGLILVNVTGLEMIKFPRRQSVLVNAASYLPTFAIILLSAGLEHWKESVIQTAFLSGMSALAWIYGKSGDKETETWASRQMRATKELQDLRRTEVLKKQFPAFIRKSVESGNLNLVKKRVLPMAVVGFADMCSSTRFANDAGLLKDWSIKEAFLEAAVTRATENGLIVLSQQGDGCFFLANFEGGDNWPLNIIAFYENLLADFQMIKGNYNFVDGTSGIKFGITMGPAVVGFIGKDQSYFTANGPDVNLAARLCSEAGPDELLVGSRVWYVLKHHLASWPIEESTLSGIKGFDGPIPVVRIRPRLKQGQGRAVCAVCGASLLVITTPEGLLDIRCANGHTGDQTVTPSQRAA